MSPQQKRSTQYDWFKGSNGKPAKKSPKDNAKTVWKFTKIFLYLALFVFSMTGCIQTFVIKTQTTVGKGVEFFANEGEIAPHVTTYQVSKEDATAPAKDIYTVASVDTNFWLSNKTTQGNQDLIDVHKEVASQNAKGDLKLQDSYKGSVEALRFVSEGSDLEKAQLLRAGANGVSGNPFVLSSQSSVYMAKTTALPTAIKVMSDEGKIFTVTMTNPALQGDVATPINKARQKYAQDIFTTLYNQEKDKLFGQIPDTLNTSKPISLVAGANLNKAQADATTALANAKDDNAKKVAQADLDLINNQIKRAAAQTAVFDTFAAYAGFKDTTPSTANNNILTFSYEAKFLPGIGTGSTDWRPLVTWGDAWTIGPFYGIFVYPIAYIAANMMHSMPFMSGWETLISIFIVVFALRMLTFALSFKATMQQTKMQELSSKKAIIDAKYAGYKGNKQMENRQKQEVSEMYKKEGVSMFGSISSIFLTMPFFLAIWRTIGALPHIKSTIWLGINFSATSWRELFAGGWQYLPLMILAAGFAAFQQILPRLLTKRRDKNRINIHQKEAMKKNNKTQNIMVIVFVFMSLIFSAGLQVYWIAGGLWMTIQSFVTHHLIIRQSKRRKHRKVKV